MCIRDRIKAEGVKANPVRQNIMIIGAGAAGLMLLKEYRTSYYLTDKVKIFIDDNEKKWNKYLDGVRIAGGRDQILASVDTVSYTHLIEAIASVRTTGKTGIEMEALHAVSAALLTIYDMCKAVDRGMVIKDILLLEKDGGKSGHYIRS